MVTSSSTSSTMLNQTFFSGFAVLLLVLAFLNASLVQADLICVETDGNDATCERGNPPNDCCATLAGAVAIALDNDVIEFYSSDNYTIGKIVIAVNNLTITSTSSLKAYPQITCSMSEPGTCITVSGQVLFSMSKLIFNPIQTVFLPSTLIGIIGQDCAPYGNCSKGPAPSLPALIASTWIDDCVFTGDFQKATIISAVGLPTGNPDYPNQALFLTNCQFENTDQCEILAINDAAVQITNVTAFGIDAEAMSFFVFISPSQPEYYPVVIDGLYFNNGNLDSDSNSVLDFSISDSSTGPWNIKIVDVIINNFTATNYVSFKCDLDETQFCGTITLSYFTLSNAGVGDSVIQVNGPFLNYFQNVNILSVTPQSHSFPTALILNCLNVSLSGVLIQSSDILAIHLGSDIMDMISLDGVSVLSCNCPWSSPVSPQEEIGFINIQTFANKLTDIELISLYALSNEGAIPLTINIKEGNDSSVVPVLLKESSFVNNNGTENAASVLLVATQTQLTVKNCSFLNNQGPQAAAEIGCFNYDDDTSVSLTDATSFFGNQSTINAYLNSKEECKIMCDSSVKDSTCPSGNTTAIVLGVLFGVGGTLLLIFIVIAAVFLVLKRRRTSYQSINDSI